VFFTKPQAGIKRAVRGRHLALTEKSVDMAVHSLVSNISGGKKIITASREHCLHDARLPCLSRSQLTGYTFSFSSSDFS
jgi:hypothetical protein